MRNTCSGAHPLSVIAQRLAFLRNRTLAVYTYVRFVITYILSFPAALICFVLHIPARIRKVRTCSTPSVPRSIRMCQCYRFDIEVRACG